MPKGAPSQFSLYDSSKPLPSIYAKKAAKELKEVPEQISAHLESFRRWINSMPHLSCPTDDNFLLAFLRHAKYNHLVAQRRLDNFCTFRTSPTEGFPEWFNNSSASRAAWNTWIDLKCWTFLGFTKEGTATIMARCKEINLDKLPLSALHTAMQMWNDACLIDARVQIGGLCMIMDLSDLRREMLSKMFDAKISKLSTKYFQEGLPFRIKKLIYYNTPKMFEAMFKIYSEWLNEKIKSRIMVLNADMNPAFDAVPGLKEIVPEAFGGDCKLTFEEICEREAPTFKSLVEHAPHFEITVDESKRPKECRNLMGTYKDLSEDVMGKVGTYVKLNQDEI
uniref:CRAL-TRIO domain-containing protein n=1 Tax=Mesocestoides corti TaxID=53468 RepID=A0A5K3FU38_MESCO